jgi:predicted RNase H-like HicB family nuclease
MHPMAKFSYVIIVEKGKGNYGAYAPDLPGCVAVGDTIEETMREMAEAIEFHLEGLRSARLLPFLRRQAARLNWSSSISRSGLDSFATPACFDDC